MSFESHARSSRLKALLSYIFMLPAFDSLLIVCCVTHFIVRNFIQLFVSGELSVVSLKNLSLIIRH